MKTKLLLYIIPLLISCSPQPRRLDTEMEHMSYNDSVMNVYNKMSKSDIIYDPVVKFFIQYQLDNPNWYPSDTTYLVKAFKNKCLMDFTFLTQLTSYHQKRLTGNNFIKDISNIQSDIISVKQNTTGYTSVTKCFQYNILVPTLDSIKYNTYEIPMFYEIISQIPPNQDQTHPFISDTSTITFTKKYPNLPSGTGLHLGTFVINN